MDSEIGSRQVNTPLMMPITLMQKEKKSFMQLKMAKLSIFATMVVRVLVLLAR